MTRLRRTLLLFAFVLLAGTVACSLPLEIVVQTSTPVATPSATQALSPTPQATTPPPPTPTRTTAPTATTVATRTPTPQPSHTATLAPSPTATSSPYTTAPAILSQTDYGVVERVQLTNAGPGSVERLTLWVALITSLEPYQEIIEWDVQPPDFEVVNDEYGNQYARIEYRNLPAGESVEATVGYQVRVNELAYDLSFCSGQMLDSFLQPETYVESDAEEIKSLAQQLSEASASPCHTLRALYDYVGDFITYSSYESGDRGAVWALQQASGDCTEFSDALLALSRAAGIPARFLEGVTYRAGERPDPSQIKHDWLEAYLPGHGWVPLDPTWGRFPERRERYFAQMSPDHIVVTRGRNLSTLGGYHYFYYNWSGKDVNLSHQEEWSVSKAQ
jgi:transglutaminase-like putative cysteine protease